MVKPLHNLGSASYQPPANAGLAMIVAWARDGVIGRDGGMPWHEPEDLAHFRRLTTGHAIVMGRKTHESIGRPLPGRRNLVLTRASAYAAKGCEVHTSLEAALASAHTTDACPFVIGGAAIYEQALPMATVLHITEIDADVEGDTHFPPLDLSAWVETDRRQSADGRLTFRTFARRT